MLDRALNLFDYAAAQSQRDRGIMRASIAQELNSPGYGERLYQAIVKVAGRQEFLFVDDVRAIFTEQPSHPNANGSPWVRAVNDGIIEKTGRLIQSARKSTNAHSYPQYRSKIYGKT